MLTPTTFFVDVPTGGDVSNPHKIAVHEWGDANAATTILCVHGLTRNAGDFDILANALAQNGARVLCVDIAGRGKSDYLKDPIFYSYPNYAADMGYLILALKLTSFHWVGTSMGGIIGMMVANAMPAAMQSLTINDIGCLVPASGLRRILEYVGVEPVFATREEAEANLRMRCAPYGIIKEEHWQNLFSHSIEPMSDGRFRLAYDYKISQNLLAVKEVVDVNLWPLWEIIKNIPVLLLNGAESDILPAEVAALMKATHPNLTLLTVPGVGHAPALMDDAQIEAVKNRISTA